MHGALGAARARVAAGHVFEKLQNLFELFVLALWRFVCVLCFVFGWVRVICVRVSQQT